MALSGGAAVVRRCGPWTAQRSTGQRPVGDPGCRRTGRPLGEVLGVLRPSSAGALRFPGVGVSRSSAAGVMWPRANRLRLRPCRCSSTFTGASVRAASSPRRCSAWRVQVVSCACGVARTSAPTSGESSTTVRGTSSRSRPSSPSRAGHRCSRTGRPQPCWGYRSSAATTAACTSCGSPPVVAGRTATSSGMPSRAVSTSRSSTGSRSRPRRGPSSTSPGPAGS